LLKKKKKKKKIKSSPREGTSISSPREGTSIRRRWRNLG
jgi:hypothetical protein